MDQKPTPSSPEKIQSEDTSKLNPSPTVYRSHWKYIASGVILIILVGIGAFFAGQKSTDKTNEVADTTSRPTSILITPSRRTNISISSTTAVAAIFGSLMMLQIIGGLILTGWSDILIRDIGILLLMISLYFDELSS